MAISFLDASIQHIAFYARLVEDTYIVHSSVRFDDVITNLGGAYTVEDGIFTAPANGTYYLTSTIKGIGSYKIYISSILFLGTNITIM